MQNSHSLLLSSFASLHFCLILSAGAVLSPSTSTTGRRRDSPPLRQFDSPSWTFTPSGPSPRPTHHSLPIPLFLLLRDLMAAPTRAPFVMMHQYHTGNSSNPHHRLTTVKFQITAKINLGWTVCLSVAPLRQIDTGTESTGTMTDGTDNIGGTATGTECDEYIRIFEYIGHEYIFGHSFVSIFLLRIYSDIRSCQICLYEYIRTFVGECVRV